MAGKPGAYGTTGGDTDFRKTWDKEEYAAKARERDVKQKEEGKARYEAALAGRKYVRRASTPPDAHDTEARKVRLNVAEQVGKTQIVAASAHGQSKRGKSAGFYCDACDLTFKDNLQFVEHLNSKQHLVNTGETGAVRQATLDEVKERFAWLKRKREDEIARDAVDIETRVQVAQELDERDREERRQKRNERRRKRRDSDGDGEMIKAEDPGDY